MFFWITFFLVITQRLIELAIAKRNTARLLSIGAIEFGANHYWLLVSMHSLFLLSLLSEYLYRGQLLSPFWIQLLIIFLLAQVVRIWVILTMRGRWTTRILVIKGEKLVRRFPFSIMPHPNYTVVCIEILVLPLIFNLYATAIIFTLLNAIMLLFIRIPEEQKALHWTDKLLTPSIYLP